MGPLQRGLNINLRIAQVCHVILQERKEVREGKGRRREGRDEKGWGRNKSNWSIGFKLQQSSWIKWVDQK